METGDAIWAWVSGGVLAIQLIVPLAVGLPQFRSDAFRSRTGRKPRDAKGPGKEAEGEALVPLVCPACHAPVPLQGEKFLCPFCGAPVEPPARYAAALAARAGAIRELQRAERIWRRSRWTSSAPLLWFLRLAVVLWSLTVIAAAVVGGSFEWPRFLLALAGILACVQLLVGLAFVSGMASQKKILPPAAAGSFKPIPAGAASCGQCHAPIAFAENRFAATCPYCGGDNYREVLAHAAQLEAEAKRETAHRSLLEAVRVVLGQREETMSLFGFMAVAELFYAVVFGFVFLVDVIENL